MRGQAAALWCKAKLWPARRLRPRATLVPYAMLAVAEQLLEASKQQLAVT